MAIIIGIVFLLELLWNADIVKTVTGVLKITEWVVDQLNSLEDINCKPFPLDPDRSDDPGTQFRKHS